MQSSKKHDTPLITSTSSSILTALAFALVILTYRLLPGGNNFSPVGAIAMLGGSLLASRLGSIATPLLALFVSDLILSTTLYANYNMFAPGIFAVLLSRYACYALYPLMGRLIAARGRRIEHLLFACLAGSLMFFFVTNFVTFLVFNPKTWTSFLDCYLSALPFYRNLLIGDVLFTGLFYGAWRLVEIFHAQQQTQSAGE